jgi:hypothetical protein
MAAPLFALPTHHPVVTEYTETDKKLRRKKENRKRKKFQLDNCIKNCIFAKNKRTWQKKNQ